MDEKMLILKMLEQGKINAEEAYKLLMAIESKKESYTKSKHHERHNYNNKKSYVSITLEKENGENKRWKIEKTGIRR